VTKSIGVLSIATNRYLKYWESLAKSADLLLFPDHEVNLYVFTDESESALEVGRTLKRVKVVPISTGNLGWPEATLRKFDLFRRHEGVLNDDVLMHLDADMLIKSSVGNELFSPEWESGIALVRHPGYRRANRGAVSRISSLGIKTHLRDAGRQMKYGANGTWETRQESRAFVPRAKREDYVCGGTWMGNRDELLELCEVLAHRTEDDWRNGVVAVWHDESHLNWWAAERSCSILDSEYCYVVGAPNLVDLQARIIAVDKGADRTR